MRPTIIEDIKCRRVLDSRGNWTVEVDIETMYGFGRCSAPSGASTGKYEVAAYPQGGIDKALLEIEETIAPELIGMDSEEQDVIDLILKNADGTDDFSNIGGNTAVAISLANARAAASSCGIPLYQHLGGNFSTELPFPLGNIIGGGAHANNATDIQEFLVIPVGAETVTDAVMANSLVHAGVKKAVSGKKDCVSGKGDEGAWALNVDDEGALEILSMVVEEVTGETGIDIRMGLDVAASELYKNKKYVYARSGKKLTGGEQIDFIVELIKKYSLYYVEDPLEENDFDGFSEITKKTGKACLICGDDLYVTNEKRIKDGIKKKATNAVLIKPNQCGTLTDTYKAVKAARDNNLATVLSHRSGETADDSIAHLAVAFNSPIIKTGTVGGERVAKLDELIRISEELTIRRAKMARLPLFSEEA
ncbi:phosphopyruvate hydratase [archaeon]|nr:phosphopyruvate hydratase [archaeon]